MFHRNVTTWKLGFENFVLFMKMINLNSMVSFQYRCDFVVLVDIPLRSGALEPSVLTSRKDMANGCIWSHTSVVKAKFSVCKTSDLLQHLVPSVLGSGISTLVYIEALEVTMVLAHNSRNTRFWTWKMVIIYYRILELETFKQVQEWTLLAKTSVTSAK